MHLVRFKGVANVRIECARGTTEIAESQTEIVRIAIGRSCLENTRIGYERKTSATEGKRKRSETIDTFAIVEMTIGMSRRKIMTKIGTFFCIIKTKNHCQIKIIQHVIKNHYQE